VAEIPKELFDEISEIALTIVNAGSIGDDAVAESAYIRLRELHEKITRVGQVYPFFTEVLGDFTRDNAESVRLFKQAIEQSISDSSEPLHTKMFSLAETLIEMGRVEEAEAYLVAARPHASKHGDSEALEDIDHLLRRIAQK
jgi:thioredoxin-like negative regulator of GroEL